MAYEILYRGKDIDIARQKVEGSPYSKLYEIVKEDGKEYVLHSGKVLDAVLEVCVPGLSFENCEYRDYEVLDKDTFREGARFLVNRILEGKCVSAKIVWCMDTDDGYEVDEDELNDFLRYVKEQDLDTHINYGSVEYMETGVLTMWVAKRITFGEAYQLEQLVPLVKKCYEGDEWKEILTDAFADMESYRDKTIISYVGKARDLIMDSLFEGVPLDYGYSLRGPICSGLYGLSPIKKDYTIGGTWS